MALLTLVRTHLVAEGLESIEDFADFKKDQLNEVIKNLCTPIPGIIGVFVTIGTVYSSTVKPRACFILTIYPSYLSVDARLSSISTHLQFYLKTKSLLYLFLLVHTSLA